MESLLSIIRQSLKKKCSAQIALIIWIHLLFEMTVKYYECYYKEIPALREIHVFLVRKLIFCWKEQYKNKYLFILGNVSVSLKFTYLNFYLFIYFKIGLRIFVIYSFHLLD